MSQAENNKTTDFKDIFIRKLSMQELLSIYSAHSIRHFPQNELKPVASITRMAENGTYSGYGLFENNENGKLLCYAFFTILPDKRNILLDYFAVMEEYRSHGIGSLFLKYMKDTVTEYDGLIIESEDPDYAADEEELAIRNKRLAFYAGNGAVFTGILAEVFGVHYRILFYPILNLPTLETLFTDFDAIYKHMVSKKNYETRISITLPED